MSWFDTSKLTSLANKAMKEAQKTLDSALDISEEQAEEEKASALWTSWRGGKGEGEATSAWGSFSGQAKTGTAALTDSSVVIL